MTRFDDIKNRVYEMIGQSSDNNNFSGTSALELAIKDAYRYICRSYRFKWLYKEDATKKLVYTSMASASTGTILNATSNANMYIGQKLAIILGGLVEEVEIASITPTLTLKSPGMDYNWAAGSEIAGYTAQLPADFWQIEAVTLKNTSTLDYYSLTPLDGKSYKDKRDYTGTPSHYWVTAGQLFFNRAPDYPYRLCLKYYMTPADISTSVDPLFNQAYDPVLAYKAAEIFFSRNRELETNIQNSEKYRALFEDGIMKMIADDIDEGIENED